MTTATATTNAPAATTPAKPASEKQLALIDTLRTEKVLDDTAEVMLSMLGEMRPAQIPGKFASAVITHMFTLDRADGQDTTRVRFVPVEGMYRKDDQIVRVSISKSGNWYARIALVPVEGSGRKSLDWKYVGHRIRLDNAEALTEAEAGKYLGYCVRCNAELTDPESIARGLGPVCAAKIGE